MRRHFFVSAYDVLLPRGNRGFGNSASEFGEISIPPSPSLFAGAFRSMLAASDPETLVAIEKGGFPTNPALRAVLGSFREPGTFRVSGVALCKRGEDKSSRAVFPLPADIQVFDRDGSPCPIRVKPSPVPAGIQAGLPLPMLPVLKGPQKKPLGNLFLNQRGFEAYLDGGAPEGKDLVEKKTVWKTETRIGIGLDGQTRSASDGRLYSTEAVSFDGSAGFLVSLDGLDEGFPRSGELRLGGDGRGAHFEEVEWKLGFPDLKKVSENRAFRLILSTPGIFSKGWLPELVVEKEGARILEGRGFTARLACAAIPRTETVSGWNLVLAAPKPAMRVAPSGSVFWFDGFEGDPVKLQEWVDYGLWGPSPDAQRRAEGFNQAFLASWNPRAV